MSILLDNLKKLSFFTHSPKTHESLTFNNVTEEYYSKSEKWNELFSSYYVNGKWYLNAPVSILKFTGTDLINYEDFSNIVVDWGDGTIESPSRLIHTYTDNTEHTIKIMNVQYSVEYCFSLMPITSIVIPFGVTSLGGYCFTYCTHLTSVKIPSSVTSLGGYCFHDCSNLTSVNIPSSVTSLGGYCFRNCSDLTSVILNWTTSNQIITYNSNWIDNTNSNLKFIIPQGTTSLYTAKGYPSEKLQER